MTPEELNRMIEFIIQHRRNLEISLDPERENARAAAEHEQMTRNIASLQARVVELIEINRVAWIATTKSIADLKIGNGTSNTKLKGSTKNQLLDSTVSWKDSPETIRSLIYGDQEHSGVDPLFRRQDAEDSFVRLDEVLLRPVLPEAGQEQRVHSHAESDKIYFVFEARVCFTSPAKRRSSKQARP